jgi:predicted N-acetyltransferase YhbS
LSHVTETPARADGRPGLAAPALRELTEADLPEVVRLCTEALDLPEDAAEAAEIIARLREREAGRRTIGLVAAHGSASDTARLVGVVLGSLSYRDSAVGHLDLIAVHPQSRRRGIGRALMQAAESALAERGATEVLIAGNLPYAWPGIDVRYTPAVCAATALGYEQDRTAWNMTADLTGGSAGLDEIAPVEARLAAEGTTIRRATSDDASMLDAFIRTNFSGGGWAWEVAQSLDRDRAGCHLALRSGAGESEVLGFAAYGALRPSWFGPMGTAPSAQGQGIGGVLLRRCLGDLRAAGYDRVQIGWVGPVPFYSGAVGAYIERVFFLYRKEL